MLDVGGESTRPGASTVAAEDEIERTAGAVAMLAGEFDAPISIDTRKARVAQEALAAGASIVNDISGLRHDEEMVNVAAEKDAFVVIGHIRGTPETMQDDPSYQDVLAEVAEELEASVAIARNAGISSHRIAVDPGIGFGKRLEDNLELMAHLAWLRGRLGLPLMVGASRKGFLGTITGDPVAERDAASHAACAVAAFVGADAVRVHDAAGARRAVAVGRAIGDARRKEAS